MRKIMLKSLVRYKLLKNLDEIDSFLERYQDEKREILEEKLAEILSIVSEKMDILLLKKLILDKISLLQIDMSPKELEILYQIMAKKSLKMIAQKLNKRLIFSFDTVDKEALLSMRKGFYWMGVEYNEALQKRLKDLIEKTFKGEIANEDIGAVLRDEFGSLIGANESYFKGVAEHISLQSQNISRVMQGKKYGVKYYKVVAVMDSRTSEICRSMHGRIIPASHLENQAQKILSAKNMSQKKNAAIWQSKAYNGRSDKMDANFGLPPYHFRCRTKVVPVWIEDEEVDGVMMRNTSPLKDDEIIRHIDKTGVERIWLKSNTHIQKKHKESTPQNMVKALNSITHIAPNKENSKRINAISDNGFFMVFEDDKVVTFYKPKKGAKETFKEESVTLNQEIIKNKFLWWLK